MEFQKKISIKCFDVLNFDAESFSQLVLTNFSSWPGKRKDGELFFFGIFQLLKFKFSKISNSNYLLQILKLHMVLFKLEMIQANNKLFFTGKNHTNKSNTI